LSFFEPHKHTNRLFNSLLGRLVVVSFERRPSEVYNYKGILSAVNEHFLVLKNRAGKRRFLSISRILDVVELSGKLASLSQPQQPPISCPECKSKRIWKDGFRKLGDGRKVQRWICRTCGYRFSLKNDFSLKNVNNEKLHNSRRRVCVSERETKNLAESGFHEKSILATTHLKSFEIPSLSKLRVLTKNNQYAIFKDPETERFYLDLKRGKIGRLKHQIFCRIAVPTLGNVTADFLIKIVCDVVNSLSGKSPRLAEFILTHSSTMNLAASTTAYRTLETYSYWLDRYVKWSKKNPDQLILEAKERDIQHVNENVNWFITMMMHSDLSNGTIRNAFKAIRAFYESNLIYNVKLLPQLKSKLRNTTRYEDLAIPQESLVQLWEIADVRMKVILSMMALGGFRPCTLVNLKYRHIRRDFEQGRTPIHIHVESEINKGEYASYDTFIGAEAVEALRAYLSIRRRGTRKTPPEEIVDESPLIRNEFLAAGTIRRGKIPPGITSDRISDLLRELFYRAGLISKTQRRRHQIRPYGLRKFFKTQLEARGVKTVYVEYMMGHVRSPYDRTSIEFLRSQYAAADLRIKPRPSLNDQFYQLLEDLCRRHNRDPAEVARELMKRHAPKTQEELEKVRRESIRNSTSLCGVDQRIFPKIAEGRDNREGDDEKQ